jgi:hypothetical protein
MKKIFFFLVLLLILVSGYRSNQANSDGRKNKEISAMYHRLNPNDVNAILTNNFTGQQNDGLKWNKEQHRNFLSNGSYKKDSVFQQVAEDNWVATRFVREMFYNGDTIRSLAMQLKRFEDGKIAEIWEYAVPTQIDQQGK